MIYLFDVNLVEESIQTGESCTEKALPSCSCRNLTVTSVKIKLLTTVKINVVIAILITGYFDACHMIDDCCVEFVCLLG